MGRKKKRHTTTQSSKKSQTRKVHLEHKGRLEKKWLKPEILLIGVFILALFIRLLYLNQITSTPIFHGLALDSEKYDSLALQILKGNLTYKDFIYLNPLYPFFLALIYLICGHSHLYVGFVQGIIDTISCVLIYYISSTLFNKKVGSIAALTYACYGIAIFYTGILLAPTLVIFLTLLLIASLLFAAKKGRGIPFLISGILFGLVVLARPNAILILIFLPLWFFTILKSKLKIHKTIHKFILFLIGFFLTISLVSIRNYYIEKRFSPLSVQGGINFYIGNNSKATGCFMPPHGISASPIEQVKNSIHYAEKETGKTLTPSQASRYWLFKGLQFIKDNPSDAFTLYVKKFALFWRKDEIPLNIHYQLSKTFAPIFQLPFISFGIMAPFAILGIILSLKRRKDVLLITLFTISYMISVTVFFVSARYRLPMVPILIIFSSYALYSFVEMALTKKFKNIAALGTLLVLLFWGMNKPFECFALTYADTQYYNKLGRMYLLEGRLNEAVVALKKAIAMDSHFADAHWYLGNVYLKKGLITESLNEYKRALGIKPDNAMTHNNIGIVYGIKGMVDKAIYHYRQAIDLDPNYAEPHFNLGRIYDGKGMWNKAISEYKRALAIKPRYAKAQYSLSNACFEKDMFDEAIEEYKKTLKINPDYAMAHNNLSVSYYHKGNYKLAILHCDKAVERGYRVHPNFLKLLKPYR